ncbi:Na+:solute symporter [bacterium]|nr:Na+:solute symporter [bacterium]
MRRAGKNSEEFFLSGRSMPWWLLGTSMVATTFSTDTPNLVTDLVRGGGVSANWAWWAFLLTGMLTTFVYARLWRRSGVFTDIEFYELRYGGRPAALLRGFRALYLGLFFNMVVIASVSVAAIKIGGIMFGLSPFQTIFWASLITVLYSALGGLRGVILTDFVQFGLAMLGSLAAAWYAVAHPKVGGLGNLLAHENVVGKLSLLPDFSDTNAALAIFIVPLAVQWWSVWYPGSEPGGGGYVAQRMLAAKDEQNAMGASLLFMVAHYALRPWPWIIVALASLVVFPDVDSIAAAFPSVAADKLGNDLGYPAMLTFLPPGLLGLVVASLIAAYMSTISTQINLGASYVTNDFWKRFVSPKASERELVNVGRVVTVLLMVLGGLLALKLQSAKQAFDLLMQIGAGTGLIFILRWFWWRVNAWSEIVAMIVSFVFALAIFFVQPAWADYVKFTAGVAVTTVAWVLVALATPAESREVLENFVRKLRPGGPGWAKIVRAARERGEELETPGQGWNVPAGILCTFFGCLMVYGALFATGYWIYGQMALAIGLTALAVVSGGIVVALWRRLAA